MTKRYLRLFMWGYQEHFRIVFQRLARDVFETLSAPADLKVLLVGARVPGSQNENLVCIEPEDGDWSISIFDRLLATIDSTVETHPDNNLFYGDELSVREKPERIRRDSVVRSVRRCLDPHDVEINAQSFCSRAVPIGDYYVVPVIQVARNVFERFPPISNRPDPPRGWPAGPESLLHATLQVLLDEACSELALPEPGRNLGGQMRRSEEIIRIAARNFLYSVPFAIKSQYNGRDLFEHFNYVSSLLYEGARGKGHMVLTHPENPVLEYAVRFRQPVPLHEPRWARKILQMAGSGLVAIADTESIHGLGSVKHQPGKDAELYFTVDFLDHYYWQLSQGSEVLLRSRYGTPELPIEPVPKDLFVSDYARLFPASTEGERLHVWTLLNAAFALGHGSMIVIAQDAETEASRLVQQGTLIVPVAMTAQLLERVSSVDGTILLDPHGTCHAVGVILDGPATPECTPSRGSRYNSALRYVKAGKARRLAIVVSEDKTLDIIPRLRPQMSRTTIEFKIALLERASLDDYHEPRNWLDENRFYLSVAQCERVNAALDRIEKLPREVGQMVMLTGRMSVHHDMDPSYILP